MEEIKELTREIKKLSDKVESVYAAVGGNEYLGQKGLKHEVKDHDDRLTRLEAYRFQKEKEAEVEKEKRKWGLWKSKAVGFGAGASATVAVVAPKSMWGKIAFFFKELLDKL